MSVMIFVYSYIHIFIQIDHLRMISALAALVESFLTSTFVEQVWLMALLYTSTGFSVMLAVEVMGCLLRLYTL